MCGGCELLGKMVEQLRCSMLYAAVDISRCGCASHQPACLLLPVNTPIDAAHAHIDSSRQDGDTCCAFDALGLFCKAGMFPHSAAPVL
jgi:hypothetical protein